MESRVVMIRKWEGRLVTLAGIYAEGEETAHQWDVFVDNKCITTGLDKEPSEGELRVMFERWVLSPDYEEILLEEAAPRIGRFLLIGIPLLLGAVGVLMWLKLQ